MPRARQKPAIIVRTNQTRRRVGRPRKPKKPENLANVTITPVANGYTLTSKTTGVEVFVFNDFDDMVEFMRTGLKPTTEAQNFLDSV